MEIVAWFEVINNAPPQLFLFLYMCIAFHCVQTTIFLSWHGWAEREKDNAEQEANYKESK